MSRSGAQLTADRAACADATSAVSRAVLPGLVLLGLVLLGTLVYPYASVLLFAAVLAGALYGVFERLARRLGRQRQVAAALLTLAVGLLLVLPMAAFTVSLGKQVADGVAYLKQTLEAGGVAELAADLPAPLQRLGGWALTYLAGEPASVEELAQNHGGQAAAAVSGLLKATTSVLLQLGMMLVAFFFLLVDGPRLVDWMASVMPLPPARTFEILTTFRNVSVTVLVSLLSTAGLQTLVALVGYLLTGVPQPAFFALVTFFMAFVPVVGATGVVLALAALLFVTGHSQPALYLALWGVLVVGFTDNLAKPILMKGRMRIHGAVIFFALLGGLATFGPVGLVAGPLILSFFLAVVGMCARERPSPSTG